MVSCLYKIQVKKLSFKEYTEWDRFVNDSPQGTIFHYSDWLTAYEDLLNLRILGCFRNEKLVGGCVLNLHRDWFFKSAANFGIEQVVFPYEGVILRKNIEKTKIRAIERLYRDICEALSNTFSSKGLHFIRLVNSPGLIDVRPFTSIKWDSEVRYTYYLDLQTVKLNAFSRDVKRNIKKAMSQGITLEKSVNADIFFHLYVQMLTRKDQLVATKFMKNVFERIIPKLQRKGLGEMWIAKSSSGQAVSSEIILFDKKRVYGWLAATHSDYLRTGVSTFLRYEILQELQKKGFKEIDLVGADGWGTSEFKAGFNPRLVPYYVVLRSSLGYKIATSINKIITKML